MKSSVAVVILNWNGQKHLATFLPSVVKNSEDATIYLADNCSTDNSIPYTQENFPSVKLIYNKENGGFAKGYNDALKELKEDFFILLNSDVEVTQNWIKPIVEAMEKETSIVIAQPKILSYREKTKFEYAGAAGGFIDFLGYPFCQGRIFQNMEEDKGQYDEAKEVFWATGACMFVKSKVFHELGGFDERYFAHMEEIDLCWRAKNQGHRIYYYPQSTVYHLGGGTMQNTNPRKTFLNFRNSLLTLYKNDPSPYYLLKVFIRLLLDALAFVKLLTESGPAHAWAIIRAHIAFYRMKKRRPKITQSNKVGIYSKSIVLQAFLFGRKRFQELK